MARPAIRLKDVLRLTVLLVVVTIAGAVASLVTRPAVGLVVAAVLAAVALARLPAFAYLRARYWPRQLWGRHQRMRMNMSAYFDD